MLGCAHCPAPFLGSQIRSIGGFCDQLQNAESRPQALELLRKSPRESCVVRVLFFQFPAPAFFWSSYGAHLFPWPFLSQARRLSSRPDSHFPDLSYPLRNGLPSDIRVISRQVNPNAAPLVRARLG